MECHALHALQAGTQLPPLLEGDEATPEGDTSSADTAVQALSSQIVSSMDFGSGKPMATQIMRVCTSMKDESTTWNGTLACTDNI